jgi:hypothetical protein
MTLNTHQKTAMMPLIMAEYKWCGDVSMLVLTTMQVWSN